MVVIGCNDRSPDPLPNSCVYCSYTSGPEGTSTRAARGLRSWLNYANPAYINKNQQFVIDYFNRNVSIPSTAEVPKP